MVLKKKSFDYRFKSSEHTYSKVKKYEQQEIKTGPYEQIL